MEKHQMIMLAWFVKTKAADSRKKSKQLSDFAFIPQSIVAYTVI